MTPVKLYGDRHTSEKHAEQIQKKIASQNPQAIMKEAPQLRGQKASYIMSSLVRFGTIGEVYRAFNLDVRKLEKSERESYTKAMYKVDSKQLRKSLNALFNRFDIDENLERFSNPNSTCLDSERDKAITSLHRNLDCKIDDRKNTLTPRISLIIRKYETDFHNIDIPEEKWHLWASNNIDIAPSSPEEVKKLIQKKRADKTDKKEEKIADKILKETSKIREKAMASQIINAMEKDGYNDIAVITGSYHIPGVAQYLEEEGIKFETGKR